MLVARSSKVRNAARRTKPFSLLIIDLRSPKVSANETNDEVRAIMFALAQAVKAEIPQPLRLSSTSGNIELQSWQQLSDSIITIRACSNLMRRLSVSASATTARLRSYLIARRFIRQAADSRPIPGRLAKPAWLIA